MNNNYLQQPVSKEYLGEYTDQVLLPGVEKIVERSSKQLRFEFDNKIEKLDIKMDKKFDELQDKMVAWKDEILTSNDKLSGKIDRVFTEQAAHTKSYQDLDQRVGKVEGFAAQAAPKLNLEFERA